MGFLKDIKEEFTSRFSSAQISDAVAYGFEKSFAQVLREKTVQFKQQIPSIAEAYSPCEIDRIITIILMKTRYPNYKN